MTPYEHDELSVAPPESISNQQIQIVAIPARIISTVAPAEMIFTSAATFWRTDCRDACSASCLDQRSSIIRLPNLAGSYGPRFQACRTILQAFGGERSSLKARSSVLLTLLLTVDRSMRWYSKLRLARKN